MDAVDDVDEEEADAGSICIRGPLMLRESTTYCFNAFACLCVCVPVLVSIVFTSQKSLCVCAAQATLIGSPARVLRKSCALNRTHVRTPTRTHTFIERARTRTRL